MKTIQQAMLEEIFEKSMLVAHGLNQTVGEKNDFYITLEQLERILKEFES